jgi:hypothetical protein
MGIMSEHGLSVDGQPKKSGSHSSRVIHDEILHIRAVLRSFSARDMSQSGLPAAYWRKRLQEIMQGHQLSKRQFDEIDRLLSTLKE